MTLLLPAQNSTTKCTQNRVCRVISCFRQGCSICDCWVTSCNIQVCCFISNFCVQIKWFHTNQLVLNTNTIYIIKFSLAKTQIYNSSITLGSLKLTLIESIKFLYLYMYLDSNLSWKIHKQKLPQKLSTAWYMMRKLYHFFLL